MASEWRHPSNAPLFIEAVRKAVKPSGADAIIGFASAFIVVDHLTARYFLISTRDVLHGIDRTHVGDSTFDASHARIYFRSRAVGGSTKPVEVGLKAHSGGWAANTHAIESVNVAALDITDVFSTFKLTENGDWFALPLCSPMLTHAPGDSLRMAGFPYFLAAQNNDEWASVPLIKSAVLSTPVQTDFRGLPHFLVDVTSMRGDSGSLVYSYERSRGGSRQLEGDPQGASAAQPHSDALHAQSWEFCPLGLYNEEYFSPLSGSSPITSSNSGRSQIGIVWNWQAVTDTVGQGQPCHLSVVVVGPSTAAKIAGAVKTPLKVFPAGTTAAPAPAAAAAGSFVKTV